MTKNWAAEKESAKKKTQFEEKTSDNWNEVMGPTSGNFFVVAKFDLQRGGGGAQNHPQGSILSPKTKSVRSLRRFLSRDAQAYSFFFVMRTSG